MGPNVWQDLPGHVDVPSAYLLGITACVVFLWGLLIVGMLAFAAQVFAGHSLWDVLIEYFAMAYTGYVLRFGLDVRESMIKAGH
jgi:hypothetical protein